MDLTFKRLKEDVDPSVINKLVKLEDQSDFKVKRDKNQIISSLSKMDYTLGCFCGDKLVGYIQLNPHCYRRDDLFIGNFIVDKNYRRQGIGTKIFKRAFEEYIKDSGVTLITTDVEKESSALAFYEKLDFEKSIFRSHNGKGSFVLVNTIYRLKQKLKRIESFSKLESFLF